VEDDRVGAYQAEVWRELVVALDEAVIETYFMVFFMV